MKEILVPRPCKRTKKVQNMKVMVISIVVGAFGTIHEGLVKGPEDLEIREQVSTEKSSQDLRRLAVTQTPVRNLQLTLAWKTFKGVNDNNDNNNNNLFVRSHGILSIHISCKHTLLFIVGAQIYTTIEDQFIPGSNGSKRSEASPLSEV